MVEVITLSGSLTHAGKHRQAGMLFRDIVDQLQHGHRLAYTGATEQTNLAALGKRADQVNNLHPGFQQVTPACLLFKAGRVTVNGHALCCVDRAGFVNRVTQYIHDAAQGCFTHGYGNGRIGIGDRKPPRNTFRGTHGDGSHNPVAQLLLYFQSGFPVINPEGVIHLGYFFPGKLNVNDRTNHRYDFSATHCSILFNQFF